MRLILLEDLSDMPSGSHQLEPFSLLAAEIRCVISNNDSVRFAWPGLVAEGKLKKQLLCEAFPMPSRASNSWVQDRHVTGQG